MSHLLWTFPLIMITSIVIGWAAELTAVHLSAGIALAILAWLQTSPEFAVEAAIAWSRDSHLVLANLTGSLRLLMGLGWPMVFFIYWFSTWRRKKRNPKLQLPGFVELPVHFSVEAAGLLISVVYFFFIWLSGRWSATDGIILCGMYGFYFWMLNRQRKLGVRSEHEEEEDPPKIVRRILSLSKRGQTFWILIMFIGGGAILLLTVHPFIEALKTAAFALGVSEFVFVQWVAPIASEFPEKVTAFNWARKAQKVPMAIVNMLSSIISQWTLMAGMVPLVFSLSAGSWTAIELSEFQRTEVLLTIAQSTLAILFLSDLKITWFEMLGIFSLWLIQFLLPDTRTSLVYAYGAWILIELLRLLLHPSRCIAWITLSKIILSK